MQIEHRPLQEEEEIFKAAYLSGDRQFWNCPMTYARYEQYASEGLLVQTAHSHYYKDKSRAGRGITVNQVEAKFQADVTVHVRYSYPVWHNHNYIEIVYVAAGACRNFLEHTQFDLHRGDVCILAPNALHALSCTNDDSCILNIMVNRDFFDQDFLSILRGGKLLVSFLEGILYGRVVSPYILFPTGEDPWMQTLAQRLLLEAPGTQYAYDHSISLLVGQFLLQLVREYEQRAIVPQQTSDALQDDLPIAVLEYLHVHYNHVTLPEVADYFGYSQAHLSRLLREHTGKSFQSLITQLQMEHAAQLLLRTHMPATQVAQAVGCFDASHFGKKFRRYYGLSPKQYREGQSAPGSD